MARKFDPVALAEQTADAYSAEAFGQEQWTAAAAMLADRGFTKLDAEKILRSKLTRWCRDHYAEDGWTGRAEHLARYIDEQRDPFHGLGLRGRAHLAA